MKFYGVLCLVVGYGSAFHAPRFFRDLNTHTASHFQHDTVLFLLSEKAMDQIVEDMIFSGDVIAIMTKLIFPILYKNNFELDGWLRSTKSG